MVIFSNMLSCIITCSHSFPFSGKVNCYSSWIYLFFCKYTGLLKPVNLFYFLVCTIVFLMSLFVEVFTKNITKCCSTESFQWKRKKYPWWVLQIVDRPAGLLHSRVSINIYFNTCEVMLYRKDLLHRGWNKFFLFDRLFLLLTWSNCSSPIATKGFAGAVCSLFCTSFTRSFSHFSYKKVPNL